MTFVKKVIDAGKRGYLVGQITAAEDAAAGKKTSSAKAFRVGFAKEAKVQAPGVIAMIFRSLLKTRI